MTATCSAPVLNSVRLDVVGIWRVYLQVRPAPVRSVK